MPKLWNISSLKCARDEQRIVLIVHLHTKKSEQRERERETNECMLTPSPKTGVKVYFSATAKVVSDSVDCSPLQGLDEVFSRDQEHPQNPQQNMMGVYMSALQALPMSGSTFLDVPYPENQFTISSPLMGTLSNTHQDENELPQEMWLRKLFREGRKND